MIRLTERQIEQQIVDLLSAHGWYVLRTNQFAGAVIQRQGTLERGMPDLLAWKIIPWAVRTLHASLPAARLMWIEVKGPRGTLSPVQKKWHLAAEARGETVLVARSPFEVENAIGMSCLRFGT